MGKMICEMCESSDFIKQGGLFVCQGCGMKYSPEEAKKMINGSAAPAKSAPTVKVEVTAKIDRSGDLENLRQLAERARKDGDAQLAVKYYDQIALIAPDDWEAYFYPIYMIGMDRRDIKKHAAAVTDITNSFYPTLRYIAKLPESKQADALGDLTRACCSAAEKLFDEKKSNYPIYPPVMMSKEEVEEISNKVRFYRTPPIDMICDLGDRIHQDFPSFTAAKLNAWKTGVTLQKRLLWELTGNALSGTRNNQIYQALRYVEKIQAIEPSYTAPTELVIEKKKGCYVATAVYGSYDCPEVWTLRRFRDNVLSATWYGRAFIKVYYAISPTAVKLFGKTKWFNTFWRCRLDKMTAKLRARGFKDTPYND